MCVSRARVTANPPRPETRWSAERVLACEEACAALRRAANVSTRSSALGRDRGFGLRSSQISKIRRRTAGQRMSARTIIVTAHATRITTARTAAVVGDINAWCFSNHYERVTPGLSACSASRVLIIAGQSHTIGACSAG